MTYHVAGIDLSLTHSAVVTFRGDDAGAPGEQRPFIRSVLSSPRKTGTGRAKPYATLLDRRDRIQSIAGRVVQAATHGYDPETDDVPLFVIESPLYGTSTGTAELLDRAGLFFLVVHLLFKRGIVVELATQTLKRYATGKGTWPEKGEAKRRTLLAMPRMIPAAVIVDDNEADAGVLGLMGCRAIGHPREPSAQRCWPEALASVSWPSDTARRERAEVAAPAADPHR